MDFFTHSLGMAYSFMAAGAMLLGAIIVLRFHKWAHKNSLLLISFAAGIMLAIAFAHLIPESFEMGGHSVALYILLGFLIMFFLQFVLMFHPCHDDNCDTHRTLGPAAIAGLSLHSLVDGLILAVGFGAGTELGVLTTIAVILHKIPDGITVSGILVHDGAAPKKILTLSFLTCLWTPIGTLLGFILFKDISESSIGALLGVTAGTFIFLAASDLIPETHRSKDRLAPFMLFAGVAVMLLLGLVITHAH